MALSAAAFVATAPAAGADPSGGHRYPRNVMRPQNTSRPAALVNANLYYGSGVDGIGVTTGKPRVYVVFWGSQWGTPGTDANGNMIFSGDPAGMAPRLQRLFKGLGRDSELWSGVMTQYCEGVALHAQSCPITSMHVGYPTGGALAGVWADNAAAEPLNATMAQLGQEAVRAASHFGNINATLNRSAQYFIVSAHGTHPTGFFDGGFCAWHEWNGNVGAPSTVGDIAFTNLPYIPDAPVCGQNAVNAGAAGMLDGVSIVAGHEYAETITDQNPRGGWTDAGGSENADKCSWLTSGQGAMANVALATGSFAMQSTWSNEANSGAGGCVMTHRIVGRDSFTTGYVLNDRASQAGCYQPGTLYSYSSRGQVNTVCRTGIGTYLVLFPDLAVAGGNAQVTASGSAAASCKVTGWGPSGTQEQVWVACFSFAGAAKDATFTASFAAGGGAGNTIAFARADNPTAGSYTPTLAFQYNNRGGPATVARAGPGAYTVSFPNVSGARVAGSVKVSAYGPGSGVCKVVSWGPNAPLTVELVAVQCYTSAGAASDQQFSVVYMDAMNLIGDNMMATGYVWADQPTAPAYTPSLPFQQSRTFNQSGIVTITRSGTGAYKVVLPLQAEGLDGGHVQVTAYGRGTGRCQVDSWGQQLSARSVLVLCFGNTGAAADSYFTLAYTARVQ